MLKYAYELCSLDTLNDWAREQAKARFFLIKHYERSSGAEKRRLKQAYRKKAYMLKFCVEQDVSLATLYRWLRAYEEEGIRGLAPKNTASQKGRRKSISAQIRIDQIRPLKCLSQIRDIIDGHPHIDPVTAQEAVAYLDSEAPLLKRRTHVKLCRKLSDQERKRLEAYQIGNHKNHRAKAVVLLLAEDGAPFYEVAHKAGRSKATIYRWLRLFKTTGLDFIEVCPYSEEQQQKRVQKKAKIIEILHASPAQHGINRTSWTCNTIRQAYIETCNDTLSPSFLRQTIKEAGYTWRRARKVLTSNDPEYKNKVAKILSALQSLSGDDTFFFIDEAGPWAAKKYGGKALTAKGVTRQIPEVQKNKGALKLILGIEALSNQLVWRFISRRDSQTIISFLNQIVNEYSASPRICITWDAVSSHNSMAVKRWIEETNRDKQKPKIELYPLPSKAQFLNVAESIFSGTRKAVIHNSDYQSVGEMRAAVNRHFEERNAFYMKNPKRAGNKIWDSQLFNYEELPGGLFRRM